MKRLYDILLSVLGIIFISPLCVLIGVVVKLSDGGDILFLQERIGRHGIPFRILKFRSMVPDAASHGPAVTAGNDPRITFVGRWLRHYKLDELPQLVNILRGEMSFVGPRPEVPRYVELYSSEQRQVLELRPGLTDPATLEFRNEEELLRNVENVEQYYIEYCVPRKIELNLQYMLQANLWSDTVIIVRTVFPAVDRIFGRRGRNFK